MMISLYPAYLDKNFWS